MLKTCCTKIPVHQFTKVFDENFQDPQRPGTSVSGPSTGGASGSTQKTSPDPAKDYSDGANHVLSVIHNILAQHRALESRWHSKKIKLHQRLALRLFQEDVKQGAVHKLHLLIHPLFHSTAFLLEYFKL